MVYFIEGPLSNTAEWCEPILRSLPDWFGIEKAIEHYVKAINNMPTFLARSEKGVIGFLSIKQHFRHSAEVYVMGIRPEVHRQGAGQKILSCAEKWLKSEGVEYLQVKTLGELHIDENYAKTRAFYQAMGFRPLEEFKQIWDEHNPCLVMVKRL